MPKPVLQPILESVFLEDLCWHPYLQSNAPVPRPSSHALEMKRPCFTNPTPSQPISSEDSCCTVLSQNYSVTPPPPPWGQCWVFHSISFFLIPLRQHLSLNLELDWQPANPSGPRGSVPHSGNVAVVIWPWPDLYIGARSSNSGLYPIELPPLSTGPSQTMGQRSYQNHTLHMPNPTTTWNLTVTIDSTFSQANVFSAHLPSNIFPA